MLSYYRFIVNRKCWNNIIFKYKNASDIWNLQYSAQWQGGMKDKLQEERNKIAVL